MTNSYSKTYIPARPKKIGNDKYVLDYKFLIIMA